MGLLDERDDMNEEERMKLTRFFGSGGPWSKRHLEEAASILEAIRNVAWLRKKEHEEMLPDMPEMASGIILRPKLMVQTIIQSMFIALEDIEKTIRILHLALGIINSQNIAAVDVDQVYQD